MNIKIWIKETRPQFLVLSPVLVILGTAIAYHDGYFDLIKFILTAIGLVLAHASVNILNDYFDFKSGIDKKTIRTSFSGGSGILPQGILKPKGVYLYGVLTLLLAFIIGIYLTYVSGWPLIILILIGGILIYFYTSVLTKCLMGELGAGLGLGALPVIGTYFVQTGTLNFEICTISIIPCFLTANLLLLKEFPDYEADLAGGRYHLVIAFGKKRAAMLYTGIMSLTYFWIIGSVLLGIMPIRTLISLFTIIFALKAISITLRNFENIERLMPALGLNVITILVTNLLLAIGFL